MKGDNYYISVPKPDSGGIYSTKLYRAYIMGSGDTAENKKQRVSPYEASVW